MIQKGFAVDTEFRFYYFLNEDGVETRLYNDRVDPTCYNMVRVDTRISFKLKKLLEPILMLTPTKLDNIIFPKLPALLTKLIRVKVGNDRWRFL